MTKSNNRLLTALFVAGGLCLSSASNMLAEPETSLKPTTSDVVPVPSPLSGMIALPPGTLLPSTMQPMGDLGKAVFNLKRGDYAAARREIDAFQAKTQSAGKTLQSLFVAAHLQEAEGYHERAIQTFSEVSDSTSELRALATEGQARNLAALGELKEAARRYALAARRSNSERHTQELNLKAINYYLQVGYATSANKLLTPLKELNPDAFAEEIKLYAAQSLAVQGYRNQSIKDLRNLQRTATNCDIVRGVGSFLTELHAPIASTGSQSKEMERARRLTRCGQHDSAAEILTHLAKTASANALEEAWLSLWYAQWNHDQILSYTDSRLSGPIDKGTRSRMLRWQARANWRQGKAGDAATLRLASVTATGSQPNWKDQLAAAQLYAEAHDYDRARPMFQALLKKRLPRSKRIECLWHLAWADVVEGHSIKAMVAMNNLATRYPKEARGQAAKYWLIRLNILEGKGQEALVWLKNIQDNTPDSFYAFLADGLQLEKAALQLIAVNDVPLQGPPMEGLLANLPNASTTAFHPLALPSTTPWRTLIPRIPPAGSTPLLDLPSPLRPKPPSDLEAWKVPGKQALDRLVKKYGKWSPELRMAKALADAGFTQEAGHWFIYVYDKQAANTKTPELKAFRKERSLLYQSMWYLEQPLHTLRLDPTGWPFPLLDATNVETIDSWRRRYPRVYSHSVSDANIVWGVDPSLIYGVMRTESAFGTYQQSEVGARGLMQIMPATGSRIAQTLGEPFDPAHLFEPQTNIHYGAWYLAQLLERFEGQLPLAVAAYNAGPTYVSMWSHRHAEAPIDVFIEEIPLTQTRDYVKKVLRSMSVYRTLYSTGEAPPFRPVVSPASRDGVDF